MTRSLKEIPSMPISFEEKLLEFRHLRDGGVTQTVALKRIGMTYSGFEKACRRNGIAMEAQQ